MNMEQLGRGRGGGRHSYAHYENNQKPLNQQQQQLDQPHGVGAGGGGGDRGGNGGRFFEGRGRGFYRGRGRGFRGGGGRGDMNSRIGPPRDQNYYGNQNRESGTGPGPGPGGRGRGHSHGGRFSDMNSNTMGQKAMESSSSSFKDEPSSLPMPMPMPMSMEAPIAGNMNRHSSGGGPPMNMNVDHSDSFKRSLPTYGSMSETVDEGNIMSGSGGQGLNSNIKRMRYESLGAPSSGGGGGSHNHNHNHHHSHTHVQRENSISGLPNLEINTNQHDERGDRMQPFQRATSMERHSDSGSMNGAPSPRSGGPMGGGGRGSSISPRRNFSHPGRNGFGRGRGRGEFPHSHSLPHSHPYQPHPSADRSISGSSDFDTEKKDQFGRKIQPNAGRGSSTTHSHLHSVGAPSHPHLGGPPSHSTSPYGRGDGHGRHFNTGRGGRFGRGARFNNSEHPGRYGGGGRGRTGGRGFKTRTSIDHYGSRPDLSLDSYHSRPGSTFHEENNDSAMNSSQKYYDNPSTPSSMSPQVNIVHAVKRSSTPLKEREEVVDVVPPSPPAAAPSALSLAMARLADLNETMEFQYARHQQLTIEHECIKVKIETLRELPVGMDAFKEDLDKLINEMQSQQFEPAK